MATPAPMLAVPGLAPWADADPSALEAASVLEVALIATAAAIASLTRADVVRYKQASHAHAQELSAEELSKPWLDAVQSLIAQVPTTQGGAA